MCSLSVLAQFQTSNHNTVDDVFGLEGLQRAFAQGIDWSFAPTVVTHLVERYGFNMLDAFDMLVQYKFYDTDLVYEMLYYKTGVKFRDIPKTDNVQYHHNYLLEYTAGGKYNVYVDSNNPVSEAQLSIDIIGTVDNMYYVLPSNFKKALGSVGQYDSYILFSRYIYYCVNIGASDIHFDTIHINKEPVFRAMCRVGPDRVECDLFELDDITNKNMIRDTIKIRSSNQSALLDLDNGSGVTVNIPDVFNDGTLEVRFTANKAHHGYYCVCRLQETKTTSLSLDDLGFSPDLVKAIRDITERPSGLSVVTGKIRTGKNTTMSSICADIVTRKQGLSLMGLDNPIEILGEYPQINYKGEVALLTSAIKMAKKLDLDYVSLNEIPDASVAFGVRDLVNSSIHTLTTWHMNRIWHLPHKLYEYFGESYRDLISQMNLVCNQRLYKKQCPHCLKEVHRSAYEDDNRVYSFMQKHELHSTLVSTGCDLCGFTTTGAGVVVIPELLVFTQELVSELFAARYPYEMERILYRVVSDSKFSLEEQMKIALEDGRLSPTAILTIV